MKPNKERKYDRELFDRLKNSLDLKSKQNIFATYFKNPVWWLVPKGEKGLFINEEEARKQCKELRSCSPETRLACKKVVLNAFSRAEKTKRIQMFKCIGRLNGFVYPIVQGSKIYAYISMCHAQKDIPRQSIELFIGFLNALVKEIQKELELEKLYETLKPRAIALSTVHTVHRLISSTLDLDELLPRIARLSLHVVRANRCSIKLVDRAHRVLLPKTTVDLRKKKVRLKKVKVGMHAPGRAFKKSKSIRGETYMAIPLIDEDVIGVITLYDKVDGKPFSSFDQEIMQTLAEQAVIAIKNAQLYKEQERITVGSIKSLATILEGHAPGILAPRDSLARIAIEMGKAFKMRTEELRSLRYATLLHDAGEINVPGEILKKPSKLTGKEYNLVKEHPLKSIKIIKPLRALKGTYPIILHHHEKYDGTGYPKGLKGHQIPLGAKIMAVVAAFEAMIAKRPYRVKKSINRAIQEIKKHSGTQFDPKVVDVFLRVVGRRYIKSLLRKEGYGT